MIAVYIIIIIVTNAYLVTMHPHSTDCLQMKCIKVDKSLGHSPDNNFNQIAGIRTCSLNLMFCATLTGLTY